MKLKQIALWGAAMTVALAGPAALANNITNGEQKGSLLIWPRIDVTEGTTTLISLTNDWATFVNVTCYYLDANKNRVDFHFQVTRTQPLVWDAATGNLFNDSAVQSFPADGPKKGLLACWAQGGNNPISHNHLFGKATIIDYDNGTAFEYNAWAFRGLANRGADLRPVGQDGKRVNGQLVLNGLENNYEACPLNLLGNFFTKGAELDLNDQASTLLADRTLVTVAACEQDFRQDWEFLATKLDFDVWNSHEIKFTGAWECADSWHETYLGEYESPKTDPKFPAYWPNGKVQYEHPSGYGNFLYEKLDTVAAYYRLYSVASKNCTARTLPPVPGAVETVAAKKVGLIGVQQSEIKVGSGGELIVTGGDLSMSGQFNGRIRFDGTNNPPEKQ